MSDKDALEFVEYIPLPTGIDNKPDPCIQCFEPFEVGQRVIFQVVSLEYGNINLQAMHESCSQARP